MAVQAQTGPLTIDRIVCYVSVDADGDEGICGIRLGDGTWMPLIGADEARIRSLRPVAERIARETGHAVRVMRFTGAELLETIVP